MKLSVAIVNWNTCELLRRCLRSTLKHTRSLELDVWVVDNASTDGSAAMVAREFPSVNLLRNAKNLGYAAAGNQALMLSSAPYVLVLNSDVEFIEDAAGRMTQFLDEHPNVAALGCKLLNPDGSLQPSCFEPIDAGLAFGVSTGTVTVLPYRLLSRLSPDGALRRFVCFLDHDRVQHPAWFRGAAVMLRRDVVREIGGYDEQFRMYCEEIDLFYRLRERGWEVAYTPDARIIHHGGASSSQAVRETAVEFWKSLMRISHKHPDSPSVASLRLAMLSGTVLRLFILFGQLARGVDWAPKHFQACGSILKWGIGMEEEEKRSGVPVGR